MAKNYFCKDCKHNNNGWCNKLKKQGLKDIIDCEHKNKDGEIIGTIKDIEVNFEIDNNKIDTAPYKVFGAREMFWNIQLQMIGIDGDDSIEDKYKALKQIMVNLEQKLLIDEKYHGIAIDYMVDSDIVNGSKRISEMWRNEVGGYGE